MPYKKENSIYKHCTEALVRLFGRLKTLSVPNCHFRTLAVTRGFLGPIDEHGIKLYGGSLERALNSKAKGTKCAPLSKRSSRVSN